ncbi:MAG: acyl carrier protein [Chloroflexi bacterium]|nr:acyl carrier protein [Chloroflexota bacterium]MBK7919810.1 acyl carrier protein [Chloroflexota bacterium]MBP7044742.1 acyl carrier protein [Chloroflexota bacterium]
MSAKQTIRDFLSTLTQRDIQIGDDDSLLATKLLDSLKVIELIVFLESQFNVEFDSDDLTPDNLDTINALVGLLESKGGV